MRRVWSPSAARINDTAQSISRVVSFSRQEERNNGICRGKGRRVRWKAVCGPIWPT
jgi:hypothetical protein